MILEIVTIYIKAGQEAEFEVAFKEASQYVAAAHGYIKHELRRCVETPNKYVNMIHWQTVDDHMVGFRQSEAFQKFRALISPYYEVPSEMNHYEVVMQNPA
ncbi:MAG: antibiotic biosynthesis monooxygenase [Anaerolineaceae bacterium]|nr:antibiotic biosynthesis monooxygenase [Anaerolineaceae bacterium]